MDFKNQQFYKLSSHAHHAIDYKNLPVSCYLPALEEAISIAQKKLVHWKQDQEMTFQSVIAGYESITEEVGFVANIFHNMHVAHATEELQKIAEQFSSVLTKFQLSLTLDEEIFSKIKKYHDQVENEKITGEEKKVLEKIYIDFVRNGALLDKEQKKELEKIDEELSGLQIRFSENVLKATKNYELHVEDKNKLEGIPSTYLEHAEEEAKKRQKTGWVFTLDYSSYIGVMKYCKSGEIRQNIYKAYVARATGGEWNNKPLVKRTLELRLKRAQLLNFKSHAHYVLDQRMAKDVDTVKKFSHSIYERAYKKAQEEFEALRTYAATKGDFDLQKWDIPYFSEMLKQEKYSFNEEEVRPYFKLENVVEGIFTVAKKLYGLNFKKIDSIPVYAEDIEVYEVFDQSNNFLSLFYMDLFLRPTKKQGAWMTSFMEQGMFQGKKMRPHIAIVCNFAKPTSTTPSLLTWNDVITIFHEFGHALHGMLSQCQYRYLSGTNVYWDFVELPSQIMENWAKSPECLKLFAKHYKTNEVIPEALVDKIISSEKFQTGLITLRQLSFGMLDLVFHEQSHAEAYEDCDAFEKNVMVNYTFLPFLENESQTCAFSHIFAGGYAAGYYSYKWAEVLDADAFSAFKEKGIFDQDLAKSFRENILEKGGTENPETLFERFRGRPPKSDALMDRLGI